MTDTPTDAPTLSGPRRLLAYVGAWVIVAPVLVLSLGFAALATLFTDVQFEPAALVVQAVLVLAAQLTLLRQLVTLIQRSPAAMLEAGMGAVAAMHAGAILVVLAGLSIAAGLATGVTLLGALDIGAIGLPTLLPYAHVLFERCRARKAMGASAWSRRHARHAVAAGVALSVLVAAAQWAISGPLPFDRATWDALANEWDDPRYRRHRMVDGLLLTRALHGSTRAQVVALLGEPRRTEYFSDWPLVYQLGAERGAFGIDSEWLVLRFDAAGKVDEARIVHD